MTDNADRRLRRIKTTATAASARTSTVQIDTAKMMLLLCIVAALAGYCAGDAECGGPSGDNFFDDSAYVSYGDISGFEIWHGTTTCVVDGISLRYGSQWGPKHNGGGASKDRVEFESGESITYIDMDKRNHWGFEVLCQITIFTNVQVYGPYCNHDCNNDRCGGQVAGPFSHISGRYGINLDSLTWHSG